MLSFRTFQNSADVLLMTKLPTCQAPYLAASCWTTECLALLADARSAAPRCECSLISLYCMQ